MLPGPSDACKWRSAGQSLSSSRPATPSPSAAVLLAFSRSRPQLSPPECHNVEILDIYGLPSIAYLANKGRIDENLGRLTVGSLLWGNNGPCMVDTLNLVVQLEQLLVCEHMVLVTPRLPQLVQHGSDLRCLDLRIRHGLKLKAWCQYIRFPYLFTMKTPGQTQRKLKAVFWYVVEVWSFKSVFLPGF